MSAVTPVRARVAIGSALCLSLLIAQTEHRPFAQDQLTNMDMPERVLLTAGRSTVLSTDFDITRIAVTNPEIADATVVRPREVLVDGKGAGTVSLIVWGSTTRKHYDVVVDRGVEHAAAEPGQPLSRREHQHRRDRRSGDPLGRGLEQRGDAAGRGNRQGGAAQGERHQHAAASWRLRRASRCCCRCGSPR